MLEPIDRQMIFAIRISLSQEARQLLPAIETFNVWGKEPTTNQVKSHVCPNWHWTPANPNQLDFVGLYEVWVRKELRFQIHWVGNNFVAGL